LGFARGVREPQSWSNGYRQIVPDVDDATARRTLDELQVSAADRRDGPDAESGDSPAFSGSGDQPPPSIALDTGGGRLNIASNRSAKEYGIWNACGEN
jgi:hypothetical protein